MARVTPEEFAQKWAQRTGAAQPDYVRGVERVSVAPGQLAARQAQAYVQKVQQNVDRFARNSAAVTLQEWQQATVEKGAQRLAGGVQAAQGKMAAFGAAILPHIDQGKNRLAAMPKVTDADSDARMKAWSDHMRGFRRRGGGGR